MNRKITGLWLSTLLLIGGIATFGSVGKPETANQNTADLAKIKLPVGFHIEIFASNVKNARSLALAPSGTVFVGTREAGNVYAVTDANRDYKADQVIVLARGLDMPNGVAFRQGSLYVAEVDKIWRYDNIEKLLSSPNKPVLITDQYPNKSHHGWKFISFGPDGKLYVPVGAPCNICESADEIFGTITRINPDGSGREIVARGVRNTVGFTWSPKDQALWFTDNGGDNLGDDLPACEVNRAPQAGLHFGYPYCHQGDYPDPNLGKKHPCTSFTPPARKLGAHVAPLGIEFYTGVQFPPVYQGQLFVAEHGSWNRSKKIGYRVSVLKINDKQQVTSYEPFAYGWLQGERDWGRPVDIEWLPDGSMLLSDDEADVIYRIYYRK